MPSESIRWPERVRQRPHLYIGGIGESGLYRLLGEVVDNAIFEVASGCGTAVKVTLFEDSSIRVSDDGRGIPVGVHPIGIPVVQMVLSKWHTFDTTRRGFDYLLESDSFSGVSVVTALSTRLEAKIAWNGFEWTQDYVCAVPSSIRQINPTTVTGTSIRFWPDPVIFGTLRFEFDTVAHYLADKAREYRGTVIQLWNESADANLNFHHLGRSRMA